MVICVLSMIGCFLKQRQFSINLTVSPPTLHWFGQHGIRRCAGGTSPSCCNHSRYSYCPCGCIYHFEHRLASAAKYEMSDHLYGRSPDRHAFSFFHPLSVPSVPNDMQPEQKFQDKIPIDYTEHDTGQHQIQQAQRQRTTPIGHEQKIAIITDAEPCVFFQMEVHLFGQADISCRTDGNVGD